jgi:hypothetical protein
MRPDQGESRDAGRRVAEAVRRSSARHIRHLKAEVGSADQEIIVTTPVNKRALDAEGMEARMDAVRLKQMLGGALTDQERMCLQIEQNGFGCGGSSSPTNALTRGRAGRP